MIVSILSMKESALPQASSGQHRGAFVHERDLQSDHVHDLSQLRSLFKINEKLVSLRVSETSYVVTDALREDLCPCHSHTVVRKGRSQR